MMKYQHQIEHHQQTDLAKKRTQFTIILYYYNFEDNGAQLQKTPEFRSSFGACTMHRNVEEIVHYSSCPMMIPRYSHIL